MVGGVAVFVASIGMIPAASGAGASAVDVAVAEAVIAAGLDLDHVVVQRGERNYAGPHCPGKGWTCTAARTVVQVDAGKASSSTFVCTPSADGSADPAAGECAVIQVGDGQHSATCTEVAVDRWSTPSCFIQQKVMSGGGANTASVAQRVGQTSGEEQLFRVVARVRQLSVSGSNTVQITQQLTQNSTVPGLLIDQDQHAHVRYSVLQRSETGSNNANVAQSVSQDQRATRATRGFQTQRAYILGHLVQDSAGVSRSLSKQSESQRQTAPRGTSVMQTQQGPFRCCSNQTGNPHNRLDVKQSSKQQQSPGGTSTQDMQGSCESSGSCGIDQLAAAQGKQKTKSCNGKSCMITIKQTCTKGKCK